MLACLRMPLLACACQMMPLTACLHESASDCLPSCLVAGRTSRPAQDELRNSQVARSEEDCGPPAACQAEVAAAQPEGQSG